MSQTKRSNYVARTVALGLAGIVLLIQMSYWSSTNQQNNTQISQAPISTPANAPTPQVTPQPTPERRKDTTALALVKVLNSWCEMKETPYLHTGINLSHAWARRYGTDYQYYPEGADALARKLKKWPAFKDKDHVQKLDFGYFNTDTGIKTTGELYDYIELKRTFSDR